MSLTSDFQYYQFPFYQFNKVQDACLPYTTQDCNMVVSLSTASGKTAIGLAAMTYELSKDDKSKVVYISPFKGISNEKSHEWQSDKQLKKYGIVLNTGDNQAKKEDFEKNRIIITTSESLESKFRNKHDWLNDVKLFVFDEFHLLGQDGRGTCIESLIMMISELHARIITLSGTMNNAVEIAKWIKQNTNKETKCIKSNWRPNKFDVVYNVYDTYGNKNENKIGEIEKIIEEKMIGEKVLIFVHSIEFGNQLIKKIRQMGRITGFHNSTLSEKKRKELEEQFSDDYSGLDILVSTSTLAAGVNL